MIAALLFVRVFGAGTTTPLNERSVEWATCDRSARGAEQQ